MVGGPRHPHGRTGAPRFAGILLAFCLGLPDAQAGDAPVDIAPVVASPEARLDEGWRRIDLGDFEGARLVADEARRLDPALEPDAQYLKGVAWELERDHTQAVATFRDLITRAPDAPRARDAQFRLALTLADRGDPKAALRELRDVGSRSQVRAQDETGDDLKKVELCRATWTYESGRYRSGARLIRKALATVDPTALTWFTAAAHAAILAHELDLADDLDFDVPDRKVSRQFDARGAHVAAARAELDAMISLQEPWYILGALARFGQSFEDLADDLLRAPRPEGLDATGDAIFRAKVESRATDQLVKAQQYVQLGVDLALRIHWVGPETEALQREAERLGARVEALDADIDEPPG